MPVQFPYPETGWSTGSMRKAKAGPQDIMRSGKEFRELEGIRRHKESQLSQAEGYATPQMSREDTEKVWGRSADFQKGYEQETMEGLKQQLDQYGEVILRKSNPLVKQLQQSPLPDHDMMELNRDYMSEGMTGGQKEWFDKEGGSIYIKRKPLTSQGPAPTMIGGQA